MASLENKYGKSAVDATRRNALPPYLDTLFEGGIGGAGVETHNVILTTANWNNLQQNVVLTCGATNASDVICAGDNSTMDADYYLSAFGVKLTSASVVEGEEEGANTATFTFTAGSIPTTNINVVIIIVNASTEGGVPVATISRVGVVKPDGTTISIDSNGTIHSIGGGGGGGSVTGVKGDTETDYRVGNVNLTPANIGAVPTSTTVNGHALTENITISKSDVGLGNVNNTSDLNKPISAATQTALDLKVDKETGKGLSSNDFTDALLSKLNGIETGAQVNTVTGVKGNSESSYRDGNVNITKANIGLGNVDNTSDVNKPVSNATQTALNGKVDKETGKSLTSNDFTDALLTKLNGIESGAQVNTITGVKGNAESSYRTGNVNLTPANIGAVPTSRTVNGHALSANVTVTASDVGLGNVNNTSDLNKPISTATQSALDGKVNTTDIATTSNLGLVKPDGSTITIDTDGTIHSVGGGGTSSITYFESRNTSVASNAEILRITDSAITTNTIVLECTFNNPSAISGVMWTSYNGYISFIGTCIKATKAYVVLANKGN